MNNLVFGKYIPLNTPIHRLDPRAKIMAMLFTLVAIFIPAGWPAYFLIGGLVLVVLLMAQLKLNFIVRAIRPMLFMMLFLFFINILSVKTGVLLLDLGFMTIYSDAIFNTLYIMVRLILMVMITTALTATTKPLDLTLGIEYLLNPFKRIGVPSHEIAMMISIALRFIPTIIEEAMRIMNSQKSRGVDFEEGTLKEKILAILSLIVPLFSVSFQRADDLANAMEARGYIPNAKRTRYKVLKFKTADYFLLMASFALLILMIVWAIVL